MRNRNAIGLAIGSAVLAGGLALAVAQPAPPPMGPPGSEMQMGGWHGPWHHGWHQARGMFSLLHPAPDRSLSAADVQKIAEGLLLWTGNHSWKIIDVAERNSDSVGFAFATEKGDVIARFTMDRHTGQWQRES